MIESARSAGPPARPGDALRAAAAGSGAAAPVLRVSGLTKRYGERVALSSLDLALASGQFTALLGPNGAGKSTLFQVLTGLFAADAGDVEVAGHSLRHGAAAALRHIGVVFQQIALDLDLSIRRNLLFHADLHGLPRRLALERIAADCARLGVEPDLERPVRELSGGNRRKVELVRAGLHRPAVLLMDEATVGLDAEPRAVGRDALQREAARQAVQVGMEQQVATNREVEVLSLIHI